MSDQERQIPSYFKGTYRNMVLELQLNDANDHLLLTITNQDNFDCFEMTIGSKYIQERQDLSFMFQNPKQMKLYLVNHFEEVILTRDGELRFEVKIGAMKSKLLTIGIPRKEVGKQGLLNVKIEKVKQSIEEDIKTLEENFETSLQRIKEQMRQQMKRKDEQLNTMLQTINQLKRETKKHEKYIHIMFPGHPLNQANCIFYVKPSTAESIIVQPAVTTGANFVLRQEVRPGTRASLDCKILHVHNEAKLGMGFHTWGNYQDREELYESAIYWCDGVLQIGKKVIKSKPMIQKGDYLTCKIDRIQNRFTWLKKNVFVHQDAIPANIGNKSVYFVVQFRNKEDQVQIFFQE